MSSLALKTIPVRDAVGCVLPHDITRIVPGQSKGPLFRKGHIIREEDIPTLLDVGKEHIYVFSLSDGFVHEDDAAKRLVQKLAGNNLETTEPKEGRSDLRATCSGLLCVDVELLNAVNSLGEITCATLHNLLPVSQGQVVAGTRIVPLVIEEAKLQAFEKLVTKPVIEVRPLAAKKVGLVSTGSEIAHGRITDAFGPVLRKKFALLGSEILDQRFPGDDIASIAQAIVSFANAGAEMICVTGGMSVDPDDNSPKAIREAGAEIICYGAPVYPGAMFLLAWLNGKAGRIPVLGLPGCVMYHKASIFDIIVPRLLAGLEVTREDIVALGHGGFCAQCANCRYPLCSFGK